MEDSSYFDSLSIGTNSPSSPISSSSPKPVLSPQQYGHYSLQNHVSSEYSNGTKKSILVLIPFALSPTLISTGPRSRQTSVEVDHPISHEEVYKNLRKTTAEIQNYSFESKLDRDTPSKDSGISQMGENHMQAHSNGYNGHHG